VIAAKIATLDVPDWIFRNAARLTDLMSVIKL
jgi:hypothetical protein